MKKFKAEMSCCFFNCYLFLDIHHKLRKRMFIVQGIVDDVFDNTGDCLHSWLEDEKYSHDFIDPFKRAFNEREPFVFRKAEYYRHFNVREAVSKRFGKVVKFRCENSIDHACFHPRRNEPELLL